jgi:DNA-binding MarR family transcriptional regulator
VTLTQRVLLTALWRNDGMTVGQLAEYYRSTKPSTSNLIARMEKKGLLERRHDKEDRRRVLVFLTEKGKSPSHLIDFYEEVNQVLLRGFDDREKEQFVAMLERVINNARAESNLK